MVDTSPATAINRRKKSQLINDIYAIYVVKDTTWQAQPEMIEYAQCQMWNCTPRELAKNDAYKLMAHTFIHNQIARITNENAK